VGVKTKLCQEWDELCSLVFGAPSRAYRRPMGRPVRRFVGGIYHVGSHGSDTRFLFEDADDRLQFLERLAVVIERLSLSLVAYVLLGNHYHAILETPGGRISEALQRVHTWYSRRHNRRHGRCAHLFLAHPFAREIESDEDLLNTCHYLAWNPVEAGLCESPFDWPWSGAPATAGLVASMISLHTQPIQAALGGGTDWQRRYREFIAAQVATASSTRSGMSKFA
jgi:putative transposase